MRLVFIRKIISFILLTVFIFNTVIPPSYAQSLPTNVLKLLLPTAMVELTPRFTPTYIKGITVHPENPLQFDFIINTGDTNPDDTAFRDESLKLVKYFMASLTVPEDDLWVNLSPHEKNRIVPQGFGNTEMGRDLLAQDYILKQLMASLMNPEKSVGQEFWHRVRLLALEKFGTTNIPNESFNDWMDKVWIVPHKALVYEHGNSAFVANCEMKVMLAPTSLPNGELEDVSKYSVIASPEGTKQSSEVKMATSSRLGTPRHDTNLQQSTNNQQQVNKIIQEIIIPELEKEVNHGKNFSVLRQVFGALILATWYKKTLKDSLFAQVYADQNKIVGIVLQDKSAKEKIYARYLEAFRKGVYDQVKEEYDPATQEVVNRRYFSGGVMGKITPAFQLTQNLNAIPEVNRSVIVNPDRDRIVTINEVDVGSDISPRLASEMSRGLSAKSENRSIALGEGNTDRGVTAEEFDREIAPLVGLKFSELPKESQEIIFHYTNLDDLRILILASRDFKRILFDSSLPIVRKLFTKEEFDKYWSDILEICKSSGQQAYYFLSHGLPGVKNTFPSSDQFEKFWPDIVLIAKAAKDGSGSLLSDLPEVKNALTSEKFLNFWPGLVTIAQSSGDSANIIITSWLLKEIQLFGLDKFETFWPVIVTVVKRTKENSEFYFSYGIPEIRRLSKDKISFQKLSDQIVKILNNVDEKNAEFIFELELPAFRKFIKSSNDFVDWTNLCIRLDRNLTKYNKKRVVALIKKSPILNDELFSKINAIAHFNFYVELFEIYPRLGLQIWEGLFEAVKAGEVSIDLTLDEQLKIKTFVQKTRGFNVSLWKYYKIKGDDALTKVDQLKTGVLTDAMSPKDMLSEASALTEEGLNGNDIVLASVLAAVPASGASFVKKNEIVGLFEKYKSAGDRRADVPKKLRALKSFGGGEMKRSEWRLRDGQTYDPQGQVKALLDQMRYPDSGKDKSEIEKSSNEDKAKFVEKLKTYLTNGQKTDERQKVLDAFLAFVRHNDLLKEKIDAIQEDGYTTLSLLEQLFRDKDSLSQLFREIVEKDIPEELLLTGRGTEEIKNPERILKRLTGEEFLKQSDSVLAKAVGGILRPCKADDVKTKILPQISNERLKAIIEEIADVGVAQKLSLSSLIENIFTEPLTLFKAEKEKFNEVETSDVTKLAFRAVKGVGYSLWGLCAGVCVATDVAMWQDPNFFLLAMIDETKNEAVGFVHLYVKTLEDGRKVLVVPGIEPSTEFLGYADAKEVYKYIEAALRQIAKAENYAAIYLPIEENILSNRSDINKIIKKLKLPVVDLNQEIHWNTLPEPYPIKQVYNLPLEPTSRSLAIKSDITFQGNNLFDRLADDDKKLVMRILKEDFSSVAEIMRLERETFGRVFIAHREYTEKDDGRSIYLRLQTPIDGIQLLKLKGVRTRVENEKIQFYTSVEGSGFTANVATVDGGLYARKPRTEFEPIGGLSNFHAQREYDVMQLGQKNLGFVTDVPVAWGTYSLLDQKFGFVISGIKSDADYRFDSARSHFYFRDLSIERGSKLLEDDKLEEVYRQLGLQLRAFHDAGYTHRYPSLSNVGINKNPEEGEFNIIIRDLNTAKEIVGTEHEKAQQRFIDLARIINDVILINDINDRLSERMLRQFLKSYFGDFYQEKILKEVMEPDFVNRIGDVEVQFIKYIELSDLPSVQFSIRERTSSRENPFQEIIKALYRVEFAHSKFNDTPRSIAISEEINAKGLEAYIRENKLSPLKDSEILSTLDTVEVVVYKTGDLLNVKIVKDLLRQESKFYKASDGTIIFDPVFVPIYDRPDPDVNAPMTQHGKDILQWLSLNGHDRRKLDDFLLMMIGSLGAHFSANATPSTLSPDQLTVADLKAILPVFQEKFDASPLLPNVGTNFSANASFENRLLEILNQTVDIELLYYRSVLLALSGNVKLKTGIIHFLIDHIILNNPHPEQPGQYSFYDYIDTIIIIKVVSFILGENNLDEQDIRNLVVAFSPRLYPDTGQQFWEYPNQFNQTIHHKSSRQFLFELIDKLGKTKIIKDSLIKATENNWSEEMKDHNGYEYYPVEDMTDDLNNLSHANGGVSVPADNRSLAISDEIKIKGLEAVIREKGLRPIANFAELDRVEEVIYKTGDIISFKTMLDLKRDNSLFYKVEKGVFVFDPNLVPVYEQPDPDVNALMTERGKRLLTWLRESNLTRIQFVDFTSAIVQLRNAQNNDTDAIVDLPAENLTIADLKSIIAELESNWTKYQVKGTEPNFAEFIAQQLGSEIKPESLYKKFVTVYLAGSMKIKLALINYLTEHLLLNGPHQEEPGAISYYDYIDSIILIKLFDLYIAGHQLDERGVETIIRAMLPQNYPDSFNRLPGKNKFLKEIHHKSSREYLIKTLRDENANGRIAAIILRFLSKPIDGDSSVVLKQFISDYFEIGGTRQILQDLIARLKKGSAEDKSHAEKLERAYTSREYKEKPLQTPFQVKNFLEKDLVFNKDPYLLRAVDIFNKKVFPNNDREITDLTWEDVIEIYATFRNDVNNLEYDDAEKRLRLAFENQEDIMKEVNAIYKTRDEAINAASYFYKNFVESQVLSGKYGFNNPKVMDQSPSAFGAMDPANGHHRLGWFLMNFILVHNGLVPFYYKDKSEFDEINFLDNGAPKVNAVKLIMKMQMKVYPKIQFDMELHNSGQIEYLSKLDRDIVSTNYDTNPNKPLPDGLRFLGSGFAREAYAHPQFPHLAFKTRNHSEMADGPSSDEPEKMAQLAAKFGYDFVTIDGYQLVKIRNVPIAPFVYYNGMCVQALGVPIDSEEQHYLIDELKVLGISFSDNKIPNIADFNGEPMVIDNETLELADRTISVDAIQTKPTVASDKSVGGINLDPKLLNMQIQRDNRGVALPITQQSLDNLKRIKGFVPVIINISPAAKQLPQLLGINEGVPSVALAISSSR